MTPDIIEYKYFVSESIRFRILENLLLFCKEDPHSLDLSEGYRVSSVYYDNLHFDSYYNKMDGVERRFKLRFRCYPDTKDADLRIIEIKYKVNNWIMKERGLVTQKQFKDITTDSDFSGISWEQVSVLKRLYSLVKVNGFSPVLRIEYQRKALFARHDEKVRITLDSKVYCSRLCTPLETEPQIPVFPGHVSILEVKSPGYFPFWLNHIIKKYDLNRSAISKYASAVQSTAKNSAFF